MALSGQLIWGPAGNGAYFSFEWTATQNISARTSTVSWKMYGRGRSSSPTYIASNYHLSINGSEISALTGSWDGSSKFSFANAKKDSGSFTVYHDNSGAGSFDASIYAFISSSGYNWDTVAQTFNLDNIGSLGPYYSWVNLGQSQDAGTSSTTFNLTKTQIGYFQYAPPSNGKITIYSTGNYDTYGGWGTNMSTSSTETTGGSIVTGESYSNDDDGDGNNFKCVDIPVTKDTWGQVFVHGFNGAVSGTLYVVFTPDSYTISYNANGGSGTTASQTVTPGNSIALQSNGFTAPTSKIWTLTLNGNGGNNGSPTFKNNYFNKWRAGSTSGTAYAAGASYTPTANTTMYAWWGTNYVWGSTTRSDTTANGFKVTFNANSGTCSTGSLTAINTTKYEFLGWGSSADATTASWNSTSTIGQTSAYTAYAVWKPKTTKGSIKLPTPTRTNYTFKGWYTAASGGTKIGNAGASYTPTAATTLYAQWTLNQVKLTLTKGSNISSVTIDGTSTTSKNVTPGTSVTIAATPSSGYHFTNWTGYATITNNPYTFTIKEARSYTANAVANTYTVKYNGGTGVTGSTASSSHTYGTAKTLTANGFSKFGHTFKGWATSLDRANAGKVDYTNQASVFNLTTTNGATVNLYAVWEKYTKVYIYTNKKDGTSKWVPVEKYTYTGG